MADIKNVTGISKSFFTLKLKLGVFFHFLPDVFKGSISPAHFIMFLKRMLIFLSKMHHNKFVKIGDRTRIDLYVPGYPSEAFYTACRKFMVFGEKLPCATVLISVTSACKYSCNHCYQKHDHGKDMDIDILVSTVKKLQDMGIAFFNIEGGEPFLVYDRLKKVCEAIDGRSEIWVNSTGLGITPERLTELKKLNVTAIMFSLHSHIPQELNSFMGNDKAWDTMAGAVGMCHNAGIAVTFNTCLLKNAFYDGTFENVMIVAKEFKASIIQLIKPKPAGGWLETGPENFTPSDIDRTKKLVNQYNLDPLFKDYPTVSAQIIEEDPEVFGCTAGGTDRFYINAKGDLQPCEFLNISFGNINEDDFNTLYKKMREVFDKPGDCMLCERYSPNVLHLFKENNLKSLPLSPKLSKEIYKDWDRGEETDLYKRL